jgi:hypothetical protein
MLEVCASQDDLDCYQEMIEDWKQDLSRPSNHEPDRAYFMPLQVHLQPHREPSAVLAPAIIYPYLVAAR